MVLTYSLPLRVKPQNRSLPSNRLTVGFHVRQTSGIPLTMTVARLVVHGAALARFLAFTARMVVKTLKAAAAGPLADSTKLVAIILP